MAGGVWLRLRLFRDYITIAVTMVIIAYNPLAAITRERQLQSWREFRHADIIALSGTGDRELVHEYSGPTVTQHKIKTSTFFKHGRRHSRCSNISCLCSPHITMATKEHTTPPAALAGRVAGLRVRTRAWDLTVLVAYAPPYDSMPEQERDAAVLVMANWISDQCSRASGLPLPHIIEYLNDQFGLLADGTFAAEVENWHQRGLDLTDGFADFPPPPGLARAARGSAGHGSGRSLESTGKHRGRATSGKEGTQQGQRQSQRSRRSSIREADGRSHDQRLDELVAGAGLFQPL